MKCAIQFADDGLEPAAVSRQSGQYQQIVDRVLEIAGRSTEIRIGDICRNLGVNARTLLRAFRAVHGATPHRYLFSRRMQVARQLLSCAGDRPVTVTEVATRLGFVELGRFAMAYRSAFGELPSETLRRSARSGRECPSSSGADNPRFAHHRSTELSLA
jgi:AraC-like DNA-binding protein